MKLRNRPTRAEREFDEWRREDSERNHQRRVRERQAMLAPYVAILERQEEEWRKSREPTPEQIVSGKIHERVYAIWRAAGYTNATRPHAVVLPSKPEMYGKSVGKWCSAYGDEFEALGGPVWDVIAGHDEPDPEPPAEELAMEARLSRKVMAAKAAA